MQPIVISFPQSTLGRVEFAAEVSTGDRMSLDSVDFKLDSESDFTTLSCHDLEDLGYSLDFLQRCPFHTNHASTADGELKLQLQYISGVSIKFGDRELQGCRVYFALGTKLRSLLGSDILKYFNREIDYDKCELRLTQRTSSPELASGEDTIQVYYLTE